MSNWRLTAKANVSSPLRGCPSLLKDGYKPKDLKKGFSLIVACRSTGDPSHEEVTGALLLAGFCKEEAQHYDNSSWKYYFEGEICGDIDFDLAHEQHEAFIHSEDYRAIKKNHEIIADKKNDNASERSSSSSHDNSGEMGYCAKLFFTITLILPIWWIIKLPFCMGWAGIKLIYYIISWPFRLLFCCCCNTQLIPGNLGAFPKYSF